MLVKSEGIVIRKVRFSETSVIAQIYTSNYGMLGFHIPGVYSKKGQIKPSYFQPLQILELDFYLKGNQNLKKAKEIKPAHIYDSLHTDFQKSSLGLLISELLFKTIKEEEENPELYDFLKSSFLILDNQTSKLGNFIISFLINFTKYLGFYPNNNFDENCSYFHLMEGHFTETNYDQAYSMDAAASQSLSLYLSGNIEKNAEISVSSENRKNLFEQVLKYYSLHVENFGVLKSEKVLRELFK